jgi:hypothetical protein
MVCISDSPRPVKITISYRLGVENVIIAIFLYMAGCVRAKLCIYRPTVLQNISYELIPVVPKPTRGLECVA